MWLCHKGEFKLNPLQFTPFIPQYLHMEVLANKIILKNANLPLKTEIFHFLDILEKKFFRKNDQNFKF